MNPNPDVSFNVLISQCFSKKCYFMLYLLIIWKIFETFTGKKWYSLLIYWNTVEWILLFTLTDNVAVFISIYNVYCIRWTCKFENW